jgi:glutamate---cysteine ligase / carboxylate-amine ligase
MTSAPPERHHVGTRTDASRISGAEAGGTTSRLTLGVEEEFLLLDPRNDHNMPVAPNVLAALPEAVRGCSRQEFRPSMVEMATPVCTTLPELGQELSRLRRAAATAASTAGARLVAVGATPIAEPQRTVSDDPRFRAIARHYGPIARDPAVCGCHVHVGVPDRSVAIQVGNHIRDWLPVVQALTVNSPFYAGFDTGHASWRSIQLERWPSLGPTPYFESTDVFDRRVRTLVASGVMLDATMVLWYARPSKTYPTVEVRVNDVCPTVRDTMLVAGLIRALVATAIDDIANGVPAPRTPDQVLRAAHWNAAQQGLGGTLLDVRSEEPVPAWDLVDEMVSLVAPALSRYGDWRLVLAELARVREEGTGAVRQRRTFARTHDLHDVLDQLLVQAEEPAPATDSNRPAA